MLPHNDLASSTPLANAGHPAEREIADRHSWPPSCDNASVVTDSVWSEEFRPPVFIAGRRRILGRCLLLTSLLSGGLAVLGSFLPWTYYDGGDSSPSTISGLTLPSEWGVWTLIIGFALVAGGVLVSFFVSPLRSVLMVVPAAGGLTVAVESCLRRASLDNGQLVPANPQVGLQLVVAAFSLAVASTMTIWILDWRWRRPD